MYVDLLDLFLHRACHTLNLTQTFSSADACLPVCMSVILSYVAGFLLVSPSAKATFAKKKDLSMIDECMIV